MPSPLEEIGKDWLEPVGFDCEPSETGFTASVEGLTGVTIAAEEGLELHLLGSTLGIDFNDVALKLRALGKNSLRDGIVAPSVAVTTTSGQQ